MIGAQRWTLRAASEEKTEELARASGLHPVVARCLVARGISNPSKALALLQAPLDVLHDPFAMKDMDKAVERLSWAMVRGEKIAVYGDYDVDGITATALLVTFLRECGVDAIYRLSNRFSEGYGLHREGLDELHSAGSTLVVAADMGTSDAEEVAFAKSLGVDIIITDHHEPPGELPEALALLNPRRPDCSYPYKGLAGVGVMFKLVTALRSSLRESGFFTSSPPNLKRHTDLFALGTVADVVPMTGENHLLTKHGLQELTSTRKAGIQALKETSGLKDRRITAGHVGYVLGPRLNAIGRLGDARLGLELLLAQSLEEARRLARKLEEENRRRQSIQEAILEEAKRQVEEAGPLPAALVLASDVWHQGVIGIVANKIAELYWRPTMLIAIDGPLGKGSARSIPRLNLYEALSRCNQLLEEFGGHRSAAGCTIAADRIEAFREAFAEAVASLVEPEAFEPELTLDAEVPLDSWTPEVVRALEDLEPFGPAHPAPIFLARNVAIYGEPRWVGESRNHLKFRVSDGSAGREAIGFGIAGNLPDMELKPGARVDLAYQPQINRWNDNETVQLRVVSLRPPGPVAQAESPS